MKKKTNQVQNSLEDNYLQEKTEEEVVITSGQEILFHTGGLFISEASFKSFKENYPNVGKDLYYESLSYQEKEEIEAVISSVMPIRFKS